MQSTKRFSNRVEHYVRGRPSYPPALIEFFRDELGLSPSHRIVDVGSGTGLLTELFLRNGNPVIGVEPNAEMRMAGEQYLAKYSAFKSVSGTAEQTTLPDASANFLIAGQAFHWFDPIKARLEFQRVLAPGGWVALIWNERKASNSGFDGDYDDLVKRFAVEARVDQHTAVTDQADANLGPFFGPAHFKIREFPNSQALTFDDLRARLASSSYMPLPDHPTYGQMMDAARKAFEAHRNNDAVGLSYAMRAYYGKFS